jgi:hypothetical protein
MRIYLLQTSIIRPQKEAHSPTGRCYFSYDGLRKRPALQRWRCGALARDAAWASAGMAANMKMCATMMVK